MMAHTTTDDEALSTVRERLGTPVLGDICDALGRYHQFLAPQIRALRPEMKLVGRAMPVLMGDIYTATARPFGRLTEALDSLEPGEVFFCAGGLKRSAYWGELLTATSIGRGAAGAVIDGYHRDTAQVLDQSWPVFSRGSFAQDSGVRSVVLDYRVPVEVNGVTVRPGDLVVGDIDGVLVIPQEIEAEVIERALEKASAENQVLHAIKDGMTSTEAWDRYGVL